METPRGSLGSKVMLPPCRSTTIERAMASPCPLPCPAALVVKNGSDILAWMAAAMPQPVSLV